MRYGDAHRLMLMQGVGIAMQRMNQRYKYTKAQQKKLSGCASNLLAHEDLGHFEKAHHWNMQSKFYNEKFSLVMKVKKQETLYHEDHGATFKHKCGKRIVTLSLLSFSLFFWGLLFFMAFLSFFYSSLGTMLQKMMIITLLFIYNSMITTRYQNKV